MRTDNRTRIAHAGRANLLEFVHIGISLLGKKGKQTGHAMPGPNSKLYRSAASGINLTDRGTVKPPAGGILAGGWLYCP